MEKHTEHHNKDRKIDVVLDEQEYHFNVQTTHHDGVTSFVATPGTDTKEIRTWIPDTVKLSYSNGEVKYDDRIQSEKGKALQYAIWRSIKEEIVNDGPNFDRPLE